MRMCLCYYYNIALVHGSMQLLTPAIISTVVPAGILQPPFFYADDIPRLGTKVASFEHCIKNVAKNHNVP